MVLAMVLFDGWIRFHCVSVCLYVNVLEKEGILD